MAEFHVICRRDGRERDRADFESLAQAKTRATRYAEREAMIQGILHTDEFEAAKDAIQAFKPGCFKGVQIGANAVVRIEDHS
ncbi:hypothetical protein HOU02_gp372 [Caulobacter phage CcrBL9]|uniref:Uncharacterized protein n=1 Tax=Caulobacter phage CcrBL9 TaxID=2283270 RepID=A0A385EC49_9CAUD|nr:hypothetical protein HOU02_gp372 [Caulobacter phage CcrBL9]AXQ69353.1 hypothetical protein CcrBL9_gp329 [Caulobacter phage CcrBL9]